MQGIGFAPGACGELVQGQFIDGEDFLVSLPVDMWSRVTVEINEYSSEILIHPKNKVKTWQAVQKLLEYFDYSGFGAHVQVNSDIPEGKGMASSTADMVAACYAVGAALEMKVEPELISQITKQIEPSDGLMYPGLVAYNHLKCELIEKLQMLPIASILVIDLGGVIDTLEYNSKPKKYSHEEQGLCQEAYNQLKQGINQQDWAMVGKAATLSGRINQRLLFKPELEKIISIAKYFKAYGVCVAHSGSVVGILFDTKSKLIPKAKQTALENFSYLKCFETKLKMEDMEKIHA